LKIEIQIKRFLPEVDEIEGENAAWRNGKNGIIGFLWLYRKSFVQTGLRSREFHVAFLLSKFVLIALTLYIEQIRRKA
jgi:hypothetical protein